MRRAFLAFLFMAIIGFAYSADVALTQPDVSSETNPSDAWSKNNRPSFTWEAVAGATKYRYSIDRMPSTVPNANETTLPKAYFSNVDDGEKYFHVRACDDSNCGPAAHYLIRIDSTPPSPPEAASGTSKWDGTIMLSWSVPSDASGINWYNVYRNERQKIGGRDFIPNDSGVKKFHSDTNSFADSEGLVAGKDYYYKVQAVDNAGNIGAAGRIIRVNASATGENVPQETIAPATQDQNKPEPGIADANKSQETVTPVQETGPQADANAPAQQETKNPDAENTYGEQKPAAEDGKGGQDSGLLATGLLILAALIAIGLFVLPKKKAHRTNAAKAEPHAQKPRWKRQK